ncbi:hypothetical protein [Paraliomyxa miuraensis]|uniref:hypothetical protein n=1 Tax=Paraliomyxa miuraensis TaxID=376150 RepID=UPI00224D4DF4|nr:hypothetical protein [Paraliomyxa miuraensis]MCX4242887.1 hypothetical protein [Paraliomyxa miuraensis]
MLALVLIAAATLGAVAPEDEGASDAEAVDGDASLAESEPSEPEADEGEPNAVESDEGEPNAVESDEGEPSEGEPSASTASAATGASAPSAVVGGEGGGEGGGEAGESGAPARGALPSGQAKSDDVPLDEDELEGDRSRRRRDRRRDVDEGQWQVFAPYPELGPIRYRDPENRRTLWLGIDASATYLPTSFGLADHAVWSVRPAGAWALALTPWLAMGGRHAVAWYDADTARLRVHEHQAELSGRPLAGSRPDVALDDRLSVGITTHEIRWSEVADGAESANGLHDTIVHFGYGLDHLLGTRWRLGWQAQARYAWVEQDTQRQVRLSMRLAFHPRPAHRLSMDAVGYYVNRDLEPAGQPMPRHGIHGQVGLGYSWVGRAGVGPWTKVRATTHFRSGEAPVYELREESLEAGYGEVLVGMLARWP